MLNVRKCKGYEISREPFCCAVSIHHRLASKSRLQMEDLLEHDPQIHTVDFDFYSVKVFNRCENSNDVLLAVSNWESVHPLMKIIPVEWDYGIPFGLLYALEPSEKVKRLLKAMQKLKESGYF